MSDRGALGPPEYVSVACWSLTDLMQKDGKLLTATDEEMQRASARVKSKLPSDSPGEFSGPSIEKFDECTNAQKRLVCYYNLFRFLYKIGITGVRIALPSCCVLRIQNEYPDSSHPANAEEGFIEDSFLDGLISL